MSGLVSMEINATQIERVAADEAYTKWLDGDFVDEKWRFFTGIKHIRLFESSPHGDEWDLVENFDPIESAQEVAEFLQQEYDRLRFH